MNDPDRPPALADAAEERPMTLGSASEPSANEVRALEAALPVAMERAREMVGDPVRSYMSHPFWRFDRLARELAGALHAEGKAILDADATVEAGAAIGVSHGLERVGSSSFWCRCGRAYRLPSRNHSDVVQAYHAGDFEAFDRHLHAVVTGRET